MNNFSPAISFIILMLKKILFRIRKPDTYLYLCIVYHETTCCLPKTILFLTSRALAIHVSLPGTALLSLLPTNVLCFPIDLSFLFPNPESGTLPLCSHCTHA